MGGIIMLGLVYLLQSPSPEHMVTDEISGHFFHIQVRLGARREKHHPQPL